MRRLLQHGVVISALALGACASELGDGAAPFAPPERDSALPWAPGALVHLCQSGSVLPARWREADFLLALREHVVRGGSLLLEGQALQLAPALGLCDPAAAASRTLAYGFDGESGVHGLRVGVAPSPLGSELFGLPAEPHWLGGGRLVRVDLVTLRPTGLRDGVAALQLATETEGERREHGDCLVAAWERGQGRIVAAGVVATPGEAHRAAWRTLLEGHVLPWLGRGTSSPYVRIAGPSRDPVRDAWAPMPPERILPAWHEDPEPAPRPWHLGVSLPGAWIATGELSDVADHLAAQALDLVVVRVQGLERQFDAALGAAWQQRPDEVDVDRLLRFAALLHARGMQCALELPHALAPLPPTAVREAFFATLASRLFDVRRLGEQAFDGLFVTGIDAWTLRTALEGLRAQRPSVFLITAPGELPPGDAVIAQIEARAGRFAGLPIGGLDERGLRRGFRPGVAGLLRLETRPSCGASGDWLRQQAKDFVRVFGAQAHGIVLDLHDRAEWEALDRLGSWIRDPLRDAAVTTLATTGRGGARDALQTLAPVPELRPSSPAHAATTIIENAWLRLEGSGGRLLFDPTRSARFDDGALVISPNFDDVRIVGAMPGPDFLVDHARSFLPGAHADAADGELRVPSASVSWPGALRQGGIHVLRQALDAPPGRYRLRLTGRPDDGGALVELALGRHVLGYFAGAGEEHTQDYEFGIADRAPRDLVLRLRHGTRVELLGAELQRIGDVGIERQCRETAGPLAELTLDVRTSFAREERRVLALGTLPGLLLSVRYRDANPGLRTERYYEFPGYRLERRARSHGRAPWILRGEGPGLPALWIYVLDEGPTDRSSWVPGRGLLVRSAPRPYTGYRLAILLADELGPRADPEALVPALHALFEPPHLVLRERRAELPAPFAHPWPRIVRLPRSFGRELVLTDGRGARAVRTGDWREEELATVLTHRPGERILLTLGAPSDLRPGPGARRVLGLRGGEEGMWSLLRHAITPLSIAASVEFGRPLGSVIVQGEPWLYRDESRVVLPLRVGSFRLQETDAPFAGLHVTGSSTGLVRCTQGATGMHIEWPQRVLPRLPLPAHLCVAGHGAERGAWGRLLRRERNFAHWTFGRDAVPHTPRPDASVATPGR